jgi:hypothetical protein
VFHVHGIKGHLFSGTLEQLRLHQAVMPTARSGRSAPAEARTDRPAAPSDGRHGVAHDAALAYGASQATVGRQPLSCRRCDAQPRAHGAHHRHAERRLAPAGAAWRRPGHGAGLPSVPVAGDSGRLVGFVSRTDLLRAMATDPPLDVWG